MRVIPVLDVRGGTVVRGVAGRRDEYRPVQSRLAAGSDPLTIARAFRDQLGLEQLYVADLDAIINGRLELGVLRALATDGFRLLVDAGLRDDVTVAARLLKAGVDQVVVGLETCAGPNFCAALVQELGADRVVFSLDLKGGVALCLSDRWGSPEPLPIAEQIVDAGIREMIVLDLAQVGVGAGVSTEHLCTSIRQRWPHLRLITGGGVRGIDDLRAQQRLGSDGVLVASALHDGKIDRDAIQSLRRP